LRRGGHAGGMADCIFCRIVAGQIPAAKIHEDAETLVFLDIHPLAEGHALVIPKRHAVRVQDLPDAAAAALARAIAVATRKQAAALGAEGATLAVNDGPAAGQEVPHVHVHVVPRRKGDGGAPIHALPWPRPAQSIDQVKAVAERLSKA